MNTPQDILARPEDATLAERWSPAEGTRQPIPSEFESPLLRLLAHRLERRSHRRLFGNRPSPLSARVSVGALPAST